ncbi:protein of unknown function [Bradyrhizobium vignae]|uniref:Uncharacterized protein n=1 Tax=Bradyrhizobium vignae TaxID=1549949 RepID=A0A2U3Q2R2_9BRAD|nr:protein of unknown function [Bradyrhizobium vignae]
MVLAIGGGPDTRYALVSRAPYEPYNEASLGRKRPVFRTDPIGPPANSRNRCTMRH